MAMKSLPRMIATALVGTAALTASLTSALAADKVTFLTSWFAQAEHGGFYQAKATGLYDKAGLDVTIKMGGPQVNGSQLLLAGDADFIMGYDIQVLKGREQNLPLVTVASSFQFDLQGIMTHDDVADLAALKGRPILIAGSSRVTFWPWLRAKYGYTDDQIRPYTFNLAPFLSDKNAIQQGYLGSEPLSIEQQAHFKPVVLLVADAGFKGYASLIATSNDKIANKPDLVKRFVDASVEGWYSYLDGDPTPGNQAILKANPEMTQALLDYGRGVLKSHGILQSGDAATLGIGAMTDARWGAFTDDVVAQGLFPKGIDYRKAYTLKFVNQKVGMAGKSP